MSWSAALLPARHAHRTHPTLSMGPNDVEHFGRKRHHHRDLEQGSDQVDIIDLAQLTRGQDLGVVETAHAQNGAGPQDE